MESSFIGKKMKYFTKDWCFSKLADQEIEQRSKSYRDYIQGIYKKLPFVLKLLTHNINLHDGKLEIFYFMRDKKQLIIKGIFGDIELNYFMLEIKYSNVFNLDAGLLKPIFQNQEIEILSDEIEILSENLFSHRMLFSTQKDIDIQFEEIELKIQNTNPKNYKKVLCQFKTI
jgi:hypothetical protein